MLFEFRKLLKHESKIYRELRLESLKDFPNNFGANFEEAVLIDKFKFEEDIENEKIDSYIVGAFDQEHLIGICAFILDSENIGHIYQMYVKPNYMNKKVGYNLLMKTIEYTKLIDKDFPIVLCVKEGNENAYHLYKKCGFKEMRKVNCETASVNIEMQFIN